MGDPERAFREAELVLRETFTVHRSAGMPLEPRCVLAEYDRGHDAVTTPSLCAVCRAPRSR